MTNNNYRPDPLLPIYSKIFERIVFNSIFQYTEENKLLNVSTILYFFIHTPTMFELLVLLFVTKY